MSADSGFPSKIYRELTEIPSFKAAQFQGPNIIRATASAQDHVRKTNRKTAKTFVLSGDAVNVTGSPDESEVVASLVSPTGKHLAILRETGGSSDKKRFVEVWAGDRLHAVEDVSEKHGAFYTDEFLSSVSFSPSEDKLVYVAEGKEPDNSSDPLSKFRFVPELGEAYGGKKRPTIFLYDWSRGVDSAVAPLALAEADAPMVLLAHPVFASDEKIIALGYEYSKDGRLLGVIYCPNRVAGVWQLSLPNDRWVSAEEPTLRCSSTRLTRPGVACRSPRVFTHEGRTKLVFASNPAGGPHHTCSRLEVLDLETSKLRTIVEIIQDSGRDAFPGLYTPSLPVYPFLELPTRGPFLVVSSVFRSRTTVLLVSLTSGSTWDLTPATKEQWSWTVLGTDGKTGVICVRSALNRPPELVLGTVDADTEVTWKVLYTPTLSEDLRQKLDDLVVSVHAVPERFPTETIVVRSKTRKSQPCITMPHGGPHSASSTAFFAASTAFAVEGYTVAFPNYTGSIGYGEKYIQELPGKCGRLDIDDCMASVRYLIEQGISEEGKQYLLSGSHGGFIIGHLIGQFPDDFKAAVIRNPVINLGETSTTDIPDWYFVEIGVGFRPDSVMTPDIYSDAFAMSPVAYADDVRTPLQVHIGLKDQRVSIDQGKKYYHLLKAKGREVEMFCFPEDGHAIDSLEGARAAYHAAINHFARFRTD
ncbi:hypothetical protein PsYK624_051380 [Phanerochaete sordida]|uniref:acylaminoacyl-peptidase n=1 Tax=Phanerochaete sordida TaxID=48140 RepID=A0A9P3G693_9APHY|nr:hypothetical protein PsYK624_051380 [Phanerochaete sordida]